MERKWWTLLAVNVAVFMLLLDITVVNTALPSIQKDLDASFTDIQWVVDAYALALAAVVLTAGSLADRLGRRKVFVYGLVIFTVASGLCGLAGSPTVLNLPIGVAAIVATLLKVRESRDPDATRIDWAGLVTFSASLFMLVLALLRGNEEGWGSSLIVGLLVGAAVSMALFVAIESRVSCTPVNEWSTPRARAFSAASTRSCSLAAASPSSAPFSPSGWCAKATFAARLRRRRQCWSPRLHSD